jgi:hypothetical protein
VDIGRFARNGEFGETRAAAPRAPRRDGDRETGDATLDRVNIDPGARQLAAQRLVILMQGVQPLGIVFRDQIGGNRQIAHGKSSPRSD